MSLNKILDAALLQGEFSNPTRKQVLLRAALYSVPLLLVVAWWLLVVAWWLLA